MPFSECIDDRIFWLDVEEYEKSQLGIYARLKLLEQVNTDSLSLEKLKENGLSAAPQGPIKVSPTLENYINKYFNDFYIDGFFNDINNEESYHEGHVINATVNK